MAEGYKDWSAGDILTAADLEDYTVKQSVMRFADSSARTTALSGVLAEGMVSYLKDTDSVEVYDGSAWAAVAGGKILQVVRATDTNTFSTSSLSPTDVTGVSVTITPTSATSSILLMLTGRAHVQNVTNNDLRGWFYITDSSNNAISGAEASTIGVLNLTGTGTKRARQAGALAVAWATPATTSAITYKARASVIDASAVIYLDGSGQTTQMFAVEVSA